MVSVVAINSSPRMNEGDTALVLNPFIDGMKKAGAEVEVLFTKKLKIHPCTGEFKCWGETPGVCCIRDDMDSIISKLRDAEIWVLGIPLYVPMPGEMQNLLNRTMPLLSGDIDVRGRRMFPARREEFKLRKIVLVSSCAFWEMENFDKLVWTIEETAEALGAEFAGALLRPHAETLRRMLKSGSNASDVIDAARDAGKQLVTEGRISEDAIRKVGRPLITFEQYLGR